VATTVFVVQGVIEVMLIFFIAGLYISCASSNNLGAYRIPSETGPLIASDYVKLSFREQPPALVITGFQHNAIVQRLSRTSVVSIQLRKLIDLCPQKSSRGVSARTTLHPRCKVAW